MIHVMVVDDEPLAREELTRIIDNSGEFKVLAQAPNGKAAIEKLKELHEQIEVIFLDIDMPGLNGMEVASKLVTWPAPPLIVFATAHHQYAINAFEANAIDYILKPYDENRIHKALEKVKEALKSKDIYQGKLTSLDDYLTRNGIIKKLAGHKRNAKDKILIDPDDVLYFHAKLTEVTAFTDQQELIVNSTLKEILESINPAKFAQTHKSYIVNLDKVEKVSPMFSGNFEILIKSPKGEKIPLSRRFARQLRSRLSTW